MGQNILIAEPYELLRIGLRTIFAEDQRVSHLHEVATSKELHLYLRNHEVDLVVVNQSLITEVGSLPTNRFVILTSKLDITILQEAYRHKGRGYLSENVSAGLLHAVLDCTENAFLIDPALTPWIMESLLSNPVPLLREELLTQREREIMALLKQGVDRPTIAKSLCIAETTLKTHIRNIARKRKDDTDAALWRSHAPFLGYETGNMMHKG